jgi:hypothetical protein
VLIMLFNIIFYVSIFFVAGHIQCGEGVYNREDTKLICWHVLQYAVGDKELAARDKFCIWCAMILGTLLTAWTTTMVF